MENKKIAELFDFKGKTVVITGGSQGIGFAIVRRFAEAGANIAVADINEEIGKAKTDLVSKEFGTKAIFVKTDVSVESEVKNLMNEAEKTFGKIDVMINNAGIFPFFNILEMSVEDWDKVQAVNLRGVFMCSKEAAQIMIKNDGGVIINVASIDALHPSMAGLAAYDASKHGVWGFTKSLALELCDKKIRVNAIAPGGVQTEGTGGVANPEFEKAIPMQRMGQPDEMATVALFLASDASSYMTGSIIVADGGKLLK